MGFSEWLKGLFSSKKEESSEQTQSEQPESTEQAPAQESESNEQSSQEGE